jgi:hypothetical protein
MDESKARSILSALAAGTDPVTGEVFAPDSPYQAPDIVRALFVAVRALEARPAEASAAAARQAAATRGANHAPGNAGKPWTDEEDRRLLEAFDRGQSPRAIAAAHGRTLAGIEARLEKHGRIASTQRVTSNRYGAAGARARRGDA